MNPLRLIALCSALLFCVAATPASKNAEWLTKLNMTTLQGTVYNFHSAADDGKSLVIVFWTPWCGSCAKEAPSLVEAAEQFKNKANFVSIVPGDDEMIQARQVDKFIAKHKLSYPVIRDRNLEATEGLKVQGTPTIVVIDAKMNIRYKGHKAPTSWQNYL